MKKLSDSLRELADRVDSAEQKAGDNQKVQQIKSKIAVVRAQSSEEAFPAAWAQGRVTTMEQAIASAKG